MELSLWLEAANAAWEGGEQVHVPRIMAEGTGMGGQKYLFPEEERWRRSSPPEIRWRAVASWRVMVVRRFRVFLRVVRLMRWGSRVKEAVGEEKVRLGRVCWTLFAHEV